MLYEESACFEKNVKQKTLDALYKLGLHDSEAPIILHGIVCRGDFSQVIVVQHNNSPKNKREKCRDKHTGTEDFALADIGRLTFTVELFHSTHVRGSNLTMLHSYFLHEVKNSPTDATRALYSK
jgi:hypothetical protein